LINVRHPPPDIAPAINATVYWESGQALKFTLRADKYLCVDYK